MRQVRCNCLIDSCAWRENQDAERLSRSRDDSGRGFCSVRGALLTKGPNSSFAEARRGFSSEPIHIEDEVKDQVDEVEDGRDK